MLHDTLHRRRFLALSFASVTASGAVSKAVPAWADRPPVRTATDLIVAARSQVGVTTSYDPAYVTLAFPNGDIDRVSGVCTDVIVRAYRDAFALDLQKRVHADMRTAFSKYPKRWGARAPDRNIDHRRVPNLQTFFARSGAQLDVPDEVAGWQPGDMFTSLIGGRLPHIGIVSDRVQDRRPLIIHNIGSGAREEDALLDHTITGRYRWAIDG